MTGSNISVDAPGIAAVVQAMVQEPNQAWDQEYVRAPYIYLFWPAICLAAFR